MFAVRVGDGGNVGNAAQMIPAFFTLIFFVFLDTLDQPLTNVGALNWRLKDFKQLACLFLPVLVITKLGKQG